jgi:hypothetical protein
MESVNALMKRGDKVWILQMRIFEIPAGRTWTSSLEGDAFLTGEGG